MIDDVMLEAEEKMEQALEASKRELASIRTGRANPSPPSPPGRRASRSSAGRVP